MEGKKPVIFTINFHPFVTRNLFDNGVIEKIAAGAEKLIVFVSIEKETLMKERYEKNNIEIIGISLETTITKRRNMRFRRIAEILLDTKTQYFHQLIYFRRLKSWRKYYFSRTITKLGSLFWFIRPLFRRIDQWLNPPGDLFDSYFETYKPDLVFSTDIFEPNNVEFLKSAKKHGVRTVGMVRSWDNTSTKHYLRFVPPLIIAHNELERVELKQYNDVNPKKVVLVGVPHFERYLHYKPISREAFCREVSVDPKKRIILFAPAGPLFTDTDWQICEILKEIHEKKLIPDDIHFLVRPHPQMMPDLSRFTPNEHVTIDIPATRKFDTRLVGIELEQHTVDHLADTLYHSTMLINVISTIIVEASIYDKPVITISFNGWEKEVPFVRSVERIQQEEWPAKTYPGVTPFVKSKEELVEWINKYLAHPEIHREQRANFVKNHCYQFDGNAAERIAAAVLGETAKNT